MDKLEELEKKLKEYQIQYQRLMKADKAAASRYGDEDREMRMRVLESMMVEIKKEILKSKKGSWPAQS